MSTALRVWEVGPRDGLQNEARPIPTAAKIRLIEGLAAAGVRSIEATSFVSAKAVPQMADGDEVAAKVHALPGVTAMAVVFNERGYERLVASGLRAVCVVVVVSDALSRANSRRSAEEGLQASKELVARARRDGLFVRVDIAPAWVCPYEGPTDPERVIAFADQLWEQGVDELALADTIGQAHPFEVAKLFERLGARYDMARLVGHFHDTQGLGLANVTAALTAGVRIFDASLGGLGGCPFAPGAAGNLATEDLVLLADKAGFSTGIDLAALWDVVDETSEVVGRPLGGRSGRWWRGRREGALRPG